jgi:dCTP deaminase
MSIQSDHEIVDLLKSKSPILQNFSKPADWYAKDSLVQPSSLDLHVGTIFVPPKDEPKPGDQVDRRAEYTLEPGQAVVVGTLEILDFPNNIAAFGFPPTTISDRAILMTNPGHIDPGFKGTLSFTLINMGREPYLISKGITIATLLLVKLASPPSKDFIQRHPRFTQNDPTTFELRRLGRDFLDLDQRARKAAETIVRQENAHISRTGIWLTVITAFLSAALAFGAAWFQSKGAVTELKEKVGSLENQLKIESRLKDVETKVGDLSSNSNTNSNTLKPQNPGGK